MMVLQVIKRLKEIIYHHCANFNAGALSEGWRFIAFVRLVPLFPFNLSNYLFGLTKSRVITYALTSIIFMLPGTFAYTYAGSLGEAFVNSIGMALIGKILIGIGLIVLVTVLPIFIKRMKWNKKTSSL